VKSGDYSHQECEKVPCFIVVLRTHRSPPVSFLRTELAVILIPGCERETPTGRRASTLRRMINNWRIAPSWAHGAGITDIYPHITVTPTGRHSRIIHTDRVAGRWATLRNISQT